jgi:hypothetical protein
MFKSVLIMERLLVEFAPNSLRINLQLLLKEAGQIVAASFFTLQIIHLNSRLVL